jgi:hypothetical protein
MGFNGIFDGISDRIFDRISWGYHGNQFDSMGFLIGDTMGCTLSNCPTRDTGGFFVRWGNWRTKR